MSEGKVILTAEGGLVEYEEPKPCYSCRNSMKHGGTAHRGCGKPPMFYLSIDPENIPYKVRYTIAQTTVDEAAKDELALAVVIIWPGCGRFGIQYDPNIVIACSNFEEGKAGSENQFISMFDSFNSMFGVSEDKDLGEGPRKIVPTYKGEIKAEVREAEGVE